MTTKKATGQDPKGTPPTTALVDVLIDPSLPPLMTVEQDQEEG